jgi:RNA polymerase sigma-70 factor (ECF subfamily)
MIRERERPAAAVVGDTPPAEIRPRRHTAQREFLAAFLKRHFPELQNPEESAASPLPLPLIALCLQKINTDTLDLKQLRQNAAVLIDWWEDGETRLRGNSPNNVVSIFAAIEPDLALDHGILCNQNKDPVLPAETDTITIAAKPARYLSAAVRYLLDRHASLREIDKLLEMGRVVQASSGQNEVGQSEHALLLALADRWGLSSESPEGIHSRLTRLLSPGNEVSEETNIAVSWYLTTTCLAADNQPWTIKAWDRRRQRAYNDIRRQILTAVADQYPDLFARHSRPDSLIISPSGGAAAPDTTAQNQVALYFETLYDRHRGEIQSFIQRHTWGDMALAEDLCAEVFRRFWQQIHRGTNITNPRAWLYRTARNSMIDHYRQRQTLPLDDRRAKNLPTSGPEDSSGDPYLTNQLRQAIDGLTQKQQEVIRSRFFDELTVPETATTLGMTEGAVKSMTRRALASLKRRLAQNPETPT